MLQKPQQCFGCPLYSLGNGFSRPEGTCKNGVLIIGESLGANEVFDALPFRPHAEAGSALHTALRFLSGSGGGIYDRKNFALFNMIQCQPPYNNLENASYEYEAINHCKVHFNAVIQRFKPKVILALGNVPLKHLWKRPQEIEDYIASLPETNKEEKKLKTKYLKNFKIGSMRGYILESVYDIPLISSFHPSYITHNKGRVHLGTLMRDIKIAVQLAQHSLPKFQTAYDEDPSPEKIKDFYNYCKLNPNLVISHDIETPYTKLEIDESEIEFENADIRDIDSIQFSVKEGTAIFIPFYGDFNLELIKKILALPNPKVGHNSWKFDEINIEYHLGVGAVNGENHDTMWMFKWLNQDFGRENKGLALQFATNFASPEFPAWKHLAQIYPKNYGCLDPDATLRLFNWLKKSFLNPAFRFKNPLTKKLIEDSTKNLWQGYLDDIVYLRPILKDISKRGFPIDVEQREIFKRKIIKERDITLVELQDMYPTQLRNVSPKEGYKRVPSEVFDLTETFHKKFDFFNTGEFLITDAPKEFLLSKYIETHSRLEGKDWSGLVVKEFNFEGFIEKRYCRIQDFKPKSREQVLAYIKFKKYKVPTVRDRIKGERESTSKDLLQPLWEETGDPLLYKTIYLRELDHMLDTYVGTDSKEGWKLGSDNRVHTTFTFLPSTGQLSSVRPNIHNSPARGTKYSSDGYEELAKQFRRTIAAKPGHKLISADWSAFHINTLAFEAEDGDYMRIGRIDPHSFLAAEIILGNLEGGLLNKLKQKRPNGWDDVKWKERILINEEATIRLKDFTSWLMWDDNKLAEMLAWFKKNFKMVRNSQAKPAILGMGFGMGANKFYKMNRHTFPSKALPEKILGLMHTRFPKTFIEYHEAIKELADQQTYLISRYGYVRRFYNVYDWRLLKNPRPARAGELVVRTGVNYWVRKEGGSANEAIAYLPSNDAFGVKKEAMRALWNHPNGNLVKKFGLVNEIHDDLLFEIEDGLINEALPIIKGIMESPAHFLKNDLCPEGLITKVEMKQGRNWADMVDI